MLKKKHWRDNETREVAYENENHFHDIVYMPDCDIRMSDSLSLINSIGH